MSITIKDKPTKYLFIYVMITFPTLIIGTVLYYQFDELFSITHQFNVIMSMLIGFLVSFTVIIFIKEKIKGLKK